jgi:hypothetical protein
MNRSQSAPHLFRWTSPLALGVWRGFGAVLLSACGGATFTTLDPGIEDASIPVFISFDSSTGDASSKGDSALLPDSISVITDSDVPITDSSTILDVAEVCPFAVKTCCDGIKDGQETDVDCGGPSCAKCGTDKMCLQNSDCVQNFCDPCCGICSPDPYGE